MTGQLVALAHQHVSSGQGTALVIIVILVVLAKVSGGRGDRRQ